MSELKELLLGCTGDNPSGMLAYAYAIPACDLTTIASTFADDATNFNEQTAYALNDLVNYHGSVYTCTTAHAAGAWNAGNFTIVTNGNVRVNGAHVPEGGKGFIRVDLNDEESMHKFETLGKKWSRSGKQSAQLFHPGSTVDASEFAYQCRVSNGLIVLIPLEDGRFVQIGTRNSLAEIVGSYEGGTRENPDSRWLFDVVAYARSVIFYEAAIPLAA